MALPGFPCRQRIVAAVKKQSGGPQGSAACGGVKRPLRLGRNLLLRKQRAAQMLSSNPEHFNRRSITYKKKNRFTFVNRFVLALPIFPCSHPQSIVGEGVLNFCVRDGNRWTHTPINTNFFGDCSPTKGYTLKTEHGSPFHKSCRPIS